MATSEESMSMCKILCWIHDVCLLQLVCDMIVTHTAVQFIGKFANWVSVDMHKLYAMRHSRVTVFVIQWHESVVFN